MPDRWMIETGVGRYARHSTAVIVAIWLLLTFLVVGLAWIVAAV